MLAELFAEYGKLLYLALAVGTLCHGCYRAGYRSGINRANQCIKEVVDGH